MKRFRWFGSNSDVVACVQLVASVPGMRFVMPDAVDGRPCFLEGSSKEIVGKLFEQNYGLLAGSFSCDIQLSPGRVFVLERSGPLLYFCLPLVLSEGRIWKGVVDPSTRGLLRCGYLGLQSDYSVSPAEGHPEPHKEVAHAWSALVAKLKKLLLLTNGSWVGPAASELLANGTLQLEP